MLNLPFSRPHEYFLTMNAKTITIIIAIPKNNRFDSKVVGLHEFGKMSVLHPFGQLVRKDVTVVLQVSTASTVTHFRVWNVVFRVVLSAHIETNGLVIYIILLRTI